MFNPEELEAIPVYMQEIFRELQLNVMIDIVQRIKANNEIPPTADYEISRLYELGASKRQIKKYIKDSLDLSTQEVNHLYKDVLRKGYVRNESLYKAKGKSKIRFEDNEPLQQLIKAVKKQTNDEFKNITQSMGFAVKQPDGSLKFTKLADYYQRTLDRASVDVLSGVYDYNTVLNRTVKEMTNSGLRVVDYASGYSNRVEVAARRALMTGYNQVVGRIAEDDAELLDTEYFEITRHIGARPTHQPWQGRVYSRDELVSVCGYGTVTGLKGANCYHDMMPFIKGVSERVYTDEELDRMNQEENTPKKYGNREYTTYEALQRQRRLETKMRAQRQEIRLLSEGGASEDDILALKSKYNGTQSEYVNFSKAMNLPQEWDRVTVDGLGNIGSKSLKKKSKAVAKSENGDIIKVGSGNVALENQRYGRNKDTIVNKTYIDSGEYKRKYDNATDNQDVNKTLYVSAKEALKHRSGTVLEDMYWIDGVTGKVLCSVTDSTVERTIKYSDRIRKAVKVNNNIVTIHTHPSSMPPSIDDFNSCFNNGYKMCFVACHNGTVYRYSANEIVSSRLYSLYIQSYMNEGMSEFEAQLKAIDKLSQSYDIKLWEVSCND